MEDVSRTSSENRDRGDDSREAQGWMRRDSAETEIADCHAVLFPVLAVLSGAIPGGFRVYATRTTSFAVSSFRPVLSFLPEMIIRHNFRLID